MKIISGGQTGADRAALDVAIELGIKYDGSIPKCRLAEDGPIDSRKYSHLTELEQESYLSRTRKNVQDADATLAFSDGALTGGTRKTIEFAKELNKQYTHIDLKKTSVEDAVKEIMEWIGRWKPHVLNIAAPRESSVPGIYSKVYEVLLRVLRKVRDEQASGL